MLSDFLKQNQLSAPIKTLLLRYAQDFDIACQAKNITLPDDDFWLSRLLQVWSASDFVAEFSIGHSEKLLGLIESGDLNTDFHRAFNRHNFSSYFPHFQHLIFIETAIIWLFHPVCFPLYTQKLWFKCRL